MRLLRYHTSPTFSLYDVTRSTCLVKCPSRDCIGSKSNGYKRKSRAMRNRAREDIENVLFTFAILGSWVGATVGLLSQEFSSPITLTAIAVCTFFAGMYLGIGKSKKNRAEAETTLAEAQSTLAEAENHKNESTATLNRNKEVLSENDALVQFLKARHLGKLDFISSLNNQPLKNRVSEGIVVGKHSSQDDDAYWAARTGLIEKRVNQWKNAKRFKIGISLLGIVEQQGGICGDLSKDPSGKGCGCYLYSLPPTAVHLDHIVPQTKGGTDSTLTPC